MGDGKYWKPSWRKISALFECVVYGQVGGKRTSDRGRIMSKVWSKVLTVSLKNCKNPGKESYSLSYGCRVRVPARESWPCHKQKTNYKENSCEKIKFNLLINQLNIPAQKSVCPTSVFLSVVILLGPKYLFPPNLPKACCTVCQS